MPLNEESLQKLKPSTRRVYCYLKSCRGWGAPLHVLQGPDVGGTAAGTRLSELGRFLRASCADEELCWYYVEGKDGKKTHSTVYYLRNVAGDVPDQAPVVEASTMQEVPAPAPKQDQFALV